MELALQFENLNCEELCAIDGGNKAQDVGYQVGKYIGITATFILLASIVETFMILLTVKDKHLDKLFTSFNNWATYTWIIYL